MLIGIPFAVARHRSADFSPSFPFSLWAGPSPPVALVYVIYINPLGDLATPLTPYPLPSRLFFLHNIHMTISNKALALFIVMFVFSNFGIAKTRIMIDPGHGGEDEGAAQNGVKEKDVTLRV